MLSYIETQSGSRKQFDKIVDRKQMDFTAHQIGDSWLTDTRNLAARACVSLFSLIQETKARIMAERMRRFLGFSGGETVAPG